MCDLVWMWRDTQQIVLCAVTAGLYAAIMIPFKIAVIIPGFTEIRPGTVIPIICSLMFGPAGAWGSAFGNLIADFIGGMFGPASAFGFLGNLFYGYLPYKIGFLISQDDPIANSISQWTKFIFMILVSSATCALIVAWGVDLLGFVPFKVLSIAIFLNNSVLAIVLSPILLRLLYPRVRKLKLLYQSTYPRMNLLSKMGVILVTVGSLGGILFGSLGGISIGISFFIILLMVGLFLL